MEDRIRFSNEKALRTVESLLDHVSEKYLIECANYIEARHYADVVEERAVSSLCGYPICPNPLTRIPHQQYHISLKSNRVYDLTQRKNFCSNFCYKASHFFETQLSTIPVWSRQIEQRFLLKINLINHNDELVDGIKPGKEIQFAKNLKKDDIENFQENLEDTTEHCHLNEPFSSLTFCESEDKQKLFNKSHKEEMKDDDRSQNFKLEKTGSQPDFTQANNILILLGKTLKEWCTSKTLKLFNQEEKFIDSTYAQKAQDSDVQLPITMNFLEANCCLAPPLPPDPPHQTTDLLDTYNQKANPSNGIDNNKELSRAGPDEDKMNPAHISPVILPPIDTIRKRIVLEKLHQVFLQILPPLELNLYDIAKTLKLMINTFHFESHNITFKPVEWLTIALGLLNLIGIHEHIVTSALRKEKNQIILNELMSEHNIAYSAILQTLKTSLYTVDF